MEDEFAAVVESAVEWDGYDESWDPTGEYSYDEHQVVDDLDDSDDDEDDACSLVSYTIGGRCLQTHVQRIDSDDDFDEEGGDKGDSGVAEEPTYGHLVNASPPDQDAVSVNDQDLDGEPCVSSSTSNFILMVFKLKESLFERNKGLLYPNTINTSRFSYLKDLGFLHTMWLTKGMRMMSMFMLPTLYPRECPLMSGCGPSVSHLHFDCKNNNSFPTEKLVAISSQGMIWYMFMLLVMEVSKTFGRCMPWIQDPESMNCGTTP